MMYNDISLRFGSLLMIERGAYTSIYNYPLRRLAITILMTSKGTVV